MQLTCTYIIKNIDTLNNTINVIYSLPGYPDITVNVYIPNDGDDIDKHIRDRLPYMSWTAPKPTSSLPDTLINKIGEISFDDSIIKVPSKEEILKKAEELKAKQLIDLEQSINKILIEQENITL